MLHKNTDHSRASSPLPWLYHLKQWFSFYPEDKIFFLPSVLLVFSVYPPRSFALYCCALILPVRRSLWAPCECISFFYLWKPYVLKGHFHGHRSLWEKDVALMNQLPLWFMDRINGKFVRRCSDSRLVESYQQTRTTIHRWTVSHPSEQCKNLYSYFRSPFHFVLNPKFSASTEKAASGDLLLCGSVFRQRKWEE